MAGAGRRDHRGRPLPDYLGMVYSPAAQDVMCVWRVEGRRFQDVRTFGYAIDVWMAPTPDIKALHPTDPVKTGRVTALLREWKREPRTLLRRFDRDGNGALSLADWERFHDLLANPKPPNAALKRAARRYGKLVTRSEGL